MYGISELPGWARTTPWACGGVCAQQECPRLPRLTAVWLSPRCLLCLSPWTCGVRPRPGGLTVDISQLSIKWKNIFYKLNCFKKNDLTYISKKLQIHLASYKYCRI